MWELINKIRTTQFFWPMKAMGEEIDKLQSQIEILEEEVAKLKARKKPGPKPKKAA